MSPDASKRAHAAVDHELAADREGPRVRRQEHDRLGNLLGIAAAPNRDLRCKRFDRLGVHADLSVQRGRDRARADRVDADAAGDQLARQSLGERQQRRFGRRINR